MCLLAEYESHALTNARNPLDSGKIMAKSQLRHNTAKQPAQLFSFLLDLEATAKDAHYVLHCQTRVIHCPVEGNLCPWLQQWAHLCVLVPDYAPTFQLMKNASIQAEDATQWYSPCLACTKPQVMINSSRREIKK